jgi:hypothetical protein
MSSDPTLDKQTEVMLLVQGACGFPSRTPDFNTCAGGLFGDRYLGYTFVSVCYFLLAMNFLFLAPILFKRDFFGLVVVRLYLYICTKNNRKLAGEPSHDCQYWPSPDPHLPRRQL